jgi:hypothetical protein
MHCYYTLGHRSSSLWDLGLGLCMMPEVDSIVSDLLELPRVGSPGAHVLGLELVSLDGTSAGLLFPVISPF